MEIIFEDSDLYVISKPSELLSVPGRLPENKDSVLSRLQEKGQAHCAHRLDMPTSGLMVVAKNKTSLRHLNKQFSNRKVCKRYQAIVHGLPEQDAHTIEAAIICDWPNRPKQIIRADGKASTTNVQVLERHPKKNISVLALEPVTGRSHQLRIHCEHWGYPILGCEFYAPEDVRSRATRLCLHASELAFSHPRTEESLSFNAAINLMSFVED